MNLIDHFNAFQEASDTLSLSANARSLYFAILGEFNRARYPAQLKLGNALLQHLSGIRSTHSFDSARNSLINARLISHKKLSYELLTGNSAETLGKFSGNSAETLGKDFLTPYQSITVTKNKDKNKDTESSTATRAQKYLDVPSVKVQEAWLRSEGTPFKPGYAMQLHSLEKLYGTDALCKAITDAGLWNKEPVLTYPLVKKFLENQVAKNGKTGQSTNGGQYTGYDICPD